MVVSGDPRSSRRRLGLVAACLAAALALASCGSSKPGYCSKVDDLKQSVSDLANVNVVANGTTSLRSAVDKVKSNANAAISSLKSDFPEQTSALSSSLSKLSDSVKQLTSSPAAALQAIPGDVSAVRTAANNLQNATQSKCS
jgi:hypothetical protein